MFNYVSKTWGGWTSDKYITMHSGFLDIVEPCDVVLADKGFPIREDLALCHAELLVPPGRRGIAQVTTNDLQLTQQIARRRIHVEKAIRRLKCFRILKFELPLTLLSVVDDAILIIAGFCNLYPLCQYN